MTQENTMDAYITSFPKEVHTILTKLKKLIKEIVPAAEETINYGIPTFKLNGKNFVHFAAYPHHIGFYPTPSVIESFKDKLSAFTTAKGSVQFPLDQPIPYDLIEEMTKYRLNNF